MARAFARIAFTPAVQAAQARMGSRDAYRSTELGEQETVELGPYEAEFIAARDSFYQGTAGENGWPYVQHRGGPAGFLKVLGPQTIGYADFSGNRQYISVGNIEGDARVSLFLMDYPGQRRLKIWGRARLVDENTEPELIARLESPDYRTRVERGVVITIEAFDWNCPKHITPRFTEQEIRERVAAAPPRREHSERSERTNGASQEIVGSGPLQLVVTGIRQLTPRIRAYELQAPDGGALPAAPAGAHLAVPVLLADGTLVTRQYSVTTPLLHRDRYEIAVLNEEAGRGGSAAIHAGWQLGTRLALELPANHFPLHPDERPTLLIAGGIGITPIRAMAQELRERGQAFTLHYLGRSPGDMAYRAELQAVYPGQLYLHATRTPGSARPDLGAILAVATPDTMIYVCGPGRLIEAVTKVAKAQGIPLGHVHHESFE